jgi:hypothetical protein
MTVLISHRFSNGSVILVYGGLKARVNSIAHSGVFDNKITVGPLNGVPGLAVMPMSNGVLGYGADGAYVNRVYLWAVTFVAYVSAQDCSIDLYRGIHREGNTYRETCRESVEKETEREGRPIFVQQQGLGTKGYTKRDLGGEAQCGARTMSSHVHVSRQIVTHGWDTHTCMLKR